MNIESKKLELISWITQLNDIAKINELLEEKNSYKTQREHTYGFSPIEAQENYEPKSIEDIRTDDPQTVEKAKSNFKWKNRSNAL